MNRLLLLGCFGVCWSASMASAQSAPAVGGGVANSGMQQGEAVVAVRSDVRLAVKGIRATLSDRLTALTREVTVEMPAVRACYTKLIATRPATVGGMRATIILEAGRPNPSIEMTEIDGTDAELSACVGKVFRRLSFREVERPAAAEVTLTFDNTRARGQAQLEERQAAFVVSVERDSENNHVGRWQTDGGEVVFEIVVPASAGADVAERLVHGVRGGFSGFLDCRRRAGRKGMNPVGEVTLDVGVGRDGKLSGHVTNSTVEDEKRTPGCVEKAISKIRLDPARRPARASIRVRFAQ